MEAASEGTRHWPNKYLKATVSNVFSDTYREPHPTRARYLVFSTAHIAMARIDIMFCVQAIR